MLWNQMTNTKNTSLKGYNSLFIQACETGILISDLLSSFFIGVRSTFGCNSVALESVIQLRQLSVSSLGHNITLGYIIMYAKFKVKYIKNHKICSTVCFVLLVASIFFLERQFARQAFKNARFKAQIPDFRVLDGVYTFSNVCLEPLEAPKLQNRPDNKIIFSETKKIVVYGYSGQENGSVVSLGVSGSPNTLWNHWELHFLHQNPPNECKSLKSIAFFIEPTCPGNFHHFFIDEFLALYSVVTLSNRLYPGANNQIIYRTPQIREVGDRCSCRRRYEEFLRSLYISEFHDVFYNFPNNTCFRQAIFGSTPLLFRQRDVIDHVLRYYNLTLHNNRNASDLFVTILARKDRRILNAEEVVSFAKEVGFRNLRIVDFHNKTIYEQLYFMLTTNVFIGIQGAGLQWAVFMPEGSYLIELAWPEKHWEFYYDRFVTSFGIKWRGVEVHDVRLNWTSYERNVRQGVPVAELEKPKLIKKRPEDNFDNIWKWSDIFIKKQEIIRTLQIVYKELQTIKGYSSLAEYFSLFSLL